MSKINNSYARAIHVVVFLHTSLALGTWIEDNIHVASRGLGLYNYN